ncbi:MAG TPA: YndJ family transporter [Ktedonobacteraceae bacterium]|nr:YndJ family transporter [Ktedonobacteraceae bacterium]
MYLRSLDPIKWNRISLSFGAIAWMTIVLARLLGWVEIDDLDLLLLLALCVITPLAITLVPLPGEKRLLRDLACRVMFLQPFATLVGAASLLSERGFFAVIEALVWLLFTLLTALLGVMMFLEKSGRQLISVCLAVALIYVPIGSTWLLLDRLGLQPLGFSQTTVLLTAVHFHFITLAALLMVGLTGQAIQATQRSVLWKIYCALASCMLVNPLLVATGITVTQVTGMHWLEAAAATLFALCLILIALFTLRFTVPATPSRLARLLLIVSSTAVVFTMLFAGAYALGAATRLWTLTFSQMILVHGWINALVFGLCGLLGWRLRQTSGKE